MFSKFAPVSVWGGEGWLGGASELGLRGGWDFVTRFVRGLGCVRRVAMGGGLVTS